MIHNLISSVLEDMAAHGVITKDTLIADGVLHRAHAEGDRSGTLNISYIIHADASPSWYFEYFPRGVKTTGSLSGKRKKLSVSELRQIEAERKRRSFERKQRQKEAAEKAKAIWQKAKPVPSIQSHAYLVKKRVKPFSLRISRGSLLVPI